MQFRKSQPQDLLSEFNIEDDITSSVLIELLIGNLLLLLLLLLINIYF